MPYLAPSGIGCACLTSRTLRDSENASCPTANSPLRMIYISRNKSSISAQLEICTSPPHFCIPPSRFRARYLIALQMYSTLLIHVRRRHSTPHMETRHMSSTTPCEMAPTSIQTPCVAFIKNRFFETTCNTCIGSNFVTRFPFYLWIYGAQWRARFFPRILA